MRLLLVADIHYALKQYDWIMAEAAQFDLLVIAGDLLEVASPVPLQAQVVVVKTYLEKLARIAPLVVCSGNHDLTEENADGERVAPWLAGLETMNVVGDGGMTTIGDLSISAFPWWDGPKTQDAIAAQLKRDAETAADTWIWVYHAPPAGSTTAWGGTRSYGDDALTGWIERYGPTAVLSGHVHHAPFVPDGSWVDRVGDSWVFNMGQQIGPAPAHIVIDTEAGEAFWFSLEGNARLEMADGNATPGPIGALPEWLIPAGPPGA